MGIFCSKQSCPNVLGFQYNPVNSSADSSIRALQPFLSMQQQTFCQENAQVMLSMLNDIPFDSLPTSIPTALLIQKLNIMIAQYTVNSIPASQQKSYQSSVQNLVTTIVNNGTVNGMVNPMKIKQQMVDIINSFCPSVSNFGSISKISKISKSTFGSDNMYYNIMIIAILVAAFYYYKKRQGSQFGRRR